MPKKKVSKGRPSKYAVTLNDLGVSYPTFRKYIALGMPVDNVESAKKWVSYNIRPRADLPRIDGRGMTPKTSDSGDDLEPKMPKSSEDDLENLLNPWNDPKDTMLKARAHKEVYEAKIAKVKLMKEQGDLVNKNEFKVFWSKRVTAIKSNIVLVPDRLTPLLMPFLKDGVNLEAIKQQIKAVHIDVLKEVVGGAE